MGVSYGIKLIRLHGRVDDESKNYVPNSVQAASFSSFTFGNQLNSVSVVMEALGWSSEKQEAMHIQWVQG